MTGQQKLNYTRCCTLRKKSVDHRRSFLLALAAGQGFCYIRLGLLGDLRYYIIWAQVWFFIAFLFFGAALALLHILQAARDGKIHRACGSGVLPAGTDTNGLLTIIILCACGFRVILWFSTPSLSDDIYRYVWEGKILAAGWNPFLYAPEAPSLSGFRDAEIFPRINHPHLSTIYPPLSLFIFALCALVSPTVAGMKLTFILFDLFTVGMLVRTLRALQMSPLNVIIYAWNPLVIVEFAGSGHLDSVGIFFLMVALYLFLKKIHLGSVAMLTLSVLCKFLSGIFLPFILTKGKMRQVFVVLLLVVVFYFPFLSTGGMLFNSLREYAEQWVFNASLYALLEFIFQSSRHARLFAAAIILSVATALYITYSKQPASQQDKALFNAVFILLGTMFVFTPVLYPWYLCWVIPVLVIIPSRSWLLLSGSIFISYLVWKGKVETGVWQESMLIKCVEYLPFYALLLYDGIRNGKQRVMMFHD